MMKDFPEALCGHEEDLNLLLEQMITHAGSEIGLSICEGVTGPMRGNNGDPTELADYYLSNIHEGWERLMKDRTKNIEKARATLAINNLSNYCYKLDDKLYQFSRRFDAETIDKVCQVCSIAQNDILFLYPAEVIKFVFRTDLNEDETRLILIEHFRENSYDYFA